ncbi:MAG: UMP kinase [Patescibacteria group bacterium]|jgi:uridylate kinase
MESPIVISVGGSLIVPNGGINTDFLIKLNNLVREEVSLGKRFMLIAGGGKLARRYQEAGTAVIGKLTKEDLDWLGIHSTHLNGHLLRTIFQDISNPRVMQHYDRKLENWTEPVAIGAGWKPGCSTDYDAVILARDHKAKIIINMSNIDYVFDKDPGKFSDAKPLKKITWEDMEKLVGDKWFPGHNSPFDPIATKLAKSLRLTVAIANGNDMENIKKIIDGKEFKGTVISS